MTSLDGFDKDAQRAFASFLCVELGHDTRAGRLNNPSIPVLVLHRFVESLPPDLRELALHLCDRGPVLNVWATRGNLTERSIVAFNPHTPEPALRRLAEDPEARVRTQLPFNPSCLPDVLARLLLDPAPEVQEALTVAFDTEVGHQLRGGRRAADLAPDDWDGV